MVNAGRKDGTALEQRFAKWLEGWNFFDRVETRQRVRGEVSLEVYEVDVLADRYDKKWDRIAFLCFLATIEGFFLALAGFTTILPATEALLVSFACGFVGYKIMMKAEARSTVSVWAECKDTKESVGREAVALLKHHVDDVRSKQRGWKPTRVYLVTSGRFDANAVRLAAAYNFICMQERDGEFVEALPPVT